ncbi:MAG: type IV secretory system conjugative DNA transfer family protein, partial [Phycisphaerales bacterium]|nr:type IV secretory system conjugative DNA transfer family protein [Phycisphaerales bacterium]
MKRRKKIYSHNSKDVVGLHADLRRGGGGPGTAAVEGFMPEEAMRSDPSLAFDIANKEGKVFLGRVGDRLMGIGDDRHCGLFAPARSGKGASHLLNVAITYPMDASCVFFDVKGDLADLSAPYRARFQRCWVLDPFCTASSAVDHLRRTGFNPMYGIDPDDDDAVVELAILLASSLVTRSQREDGHWNDVAEAAIAGVIAHVLTSPLHAHQRHLGTVYDLLTKSTQAPDEDTPCDLEAEMRTNPAAGGMVQAAAATMFEKSDRELASTL